MEYRDLIVTPILIVLIYIVAYLIRPRVADGITKRYFLPALTAKIFGALALGFLYQFYYGGGDTFNFHTLGSRYIWEAFMDSYDKGLDLIFSDGTHARGVYRYSSKIIFFHDPSSYFIIRMAGFFDLFTFSSYSATAVLFSTLGFMGGWAFFLTMYRLRPDLHKWIAIAVLFIPSVVFWGSGLLKDTITFGCLGLLTYCLDNLYRREKIISSFLLVLLCAFTIFSVKKYILLCFLPAVLLWFYLRQVKAIRSPMIKIMTVPFLAIFIGGASYYSIVMVSKGDKRYALDKIGETAMITAYDIRYWTGRDAGSGYSLGDLDGSFTSMVKLAPQAVNVSLFRPYLWEIRNPLMLLSALEGTALLFFTLYVLYKRKGYLMESMHQTPVIMFCLIFSLTFAFAVGVSTYNFGTLSRYKIPLVPYYSLALIFMLHYRPAITNEVDEKMLR
jgi:hypothetical protein